MDQMDCRFAMMKIIRWVYRYIGYIGYISVVMEKCENMYRYRKGLIDTDVSDIQFTSALRRRGEVRSLGVVIVLNSYSI